MALPSTGDICTVPLSMPPSPGSYVAGVSSCGGGSCRRRRGSRSGNLLLRRRFLRGGLRSRLRLLLNDVDGRQLVGAGGGAGCRRRCRVRSVVLGCRGALAVSCRARALSWCRGRRRAGVVVVLGGVGAGCWCSAPPAAGGEGCVCCALAGRKAARSLRPLVPAAKDLCLPCRPPASICFFRLYSRKNSTHSPSGIRVI